MSFGPLGPAGRKFTANTSTFPITRCLLEANVDSNNAKVKELALSWQTVQINQRFYAAFTSLFITLRSWLWMNSGEKRERWVWCLSVFNCSSVIWTFLLSCLNTHMDYLSSVRINSIQQWNFIPIRSSVWKRKKKLWYKHLPNQSIAAETSDRSVWTW